VKGIQERDVEEATSAALVASAAAFHVMFLRRFGELFTGLFEELSVVLDDRVHYTDTLPQ
jgi:hypothetical protein